ncbi:MAG: DnaJ C-terminal domain-containing protein [Patescibacteria group bacterium]|jgi:DnaJ-class molecular chaperone
MANGKDYYNILGVSKTASDDDIKKAYRKLAREHHPDMVAESDKSTAEKRFKEINEAYQVLSDPQKRKMYDQFGSAGPGFAGGQGQPGGQWGPFSYTYSSGGQGSPFGDVDPFDIFEDFFGFRGFGARKPRKGKNLHYEMRVDFADAIHGAEKTINIESGHVTVKIPRGVRTGTEMRFPGRGMPGPDGTPAGDLFISFRVDTPDNFQRVGDNLGVVEEIDFVQAVLGDTVDVTVVDPDSPSGLGKAKLKVPSGTQPGTQFRLSGKGMPRLSGSSRGDVIVQVMIKIPQRLSKQQKRVLEEYRDL